MASNLQEDTMEQHQQKPPPRLQIYSNTNNGVTPFWKEKYERDARKYWDIFYKRHQDKFFKDRHYLDKEWGSYFSGAGKKVVLEIGCGAGNTIFPLIATYPDIFVYACDFSDRAINLVKMHKEFSESRIGAFVCDLTTDDISQHIPTSSVDIVTMIFMLSAVSPERMHQVLLNIKKVLKPNGYILLRDYATGDLAQERFTCKDRKISENFYVRGDGTRAFYFSEEFLGSLFKEHGFTAEKLSLCCKQVENRSREIVMNRRWIQGVFHCRDSEKSSLSQNHVTKLDENGTLNKRSSSAENHDVDISDGLAADMFSTSPSNEVIDVPLSGFNFKIAVLSKEYQHTCKSTGLMLWESARLMASVLAENPSIVAGKRVLELGAGCAGICSMVSAKSAEFVVATDGDVKALDLLSENVSSNVEPPLDSKLITRRLEWGNRGHIQSIKELEGRGFNVIIGTDITYVSEAISPLFATAKELISPDRDSSGGWKSALVLCHTLRRVDEPSILSAALQYGFTLVDQWPAGTNTSSSAGLIGSWFFSPALVEHIPSSALRIMYFQTN